MKIIIAILAVVIVAFLALGVLFVQWANRPENVEALQKKRQTDATKMIEDEKRKVELDKEFEAKRANLKLVIDETFANNRFDLLDYKFDQSSLFKFEKNRFIYTVLRAKGSNPANYFIFSKEDFKDFAAEMDFDIWGREGKAGIFWDAQPNGDRDPTQYQSAYSSSSGLEVEAGGSESFNLGSFAESLTTQKFRVERFGKRLRVSVNDKVFFDKNIEKTGQGKVGIFLRNRGGSKDYSDSISIEVKSFKVWK